MSSVNLLISGSEVEIEFDSPIIDVAVGTPQVVFPISTSLGVEVEFDSPIIDVSVDTPQIVLPINAVIDASSSGAVLQIWGETPGGTINGINMNFTSAHLYSPNKLAVFLNGLRQRRNDDYTETGGQSFSFTNAPFPGDSLSIDYIQA